MMQVTAHSPHMLAHTRTRALPSIDGPPSRPDNTLTDNGARPLPNITQAPPAREIHRPRSSFGITTVNNVVIMTTMALRMVMNESSITVETCTLGATAKRL